jgi:hypothetical protein
VFLTFVVCNLLIFIKLEGTGHYAPLLLAPSEGYYAQPLAAIWGPSVQICLLLLQQSVSLLLNGVFFILAFFILDLIIRLFLRILHFFFFYFFSEMCLF